MKRLLACLLWTGWVASAGAVRPIDPAVDKAARHMENLERREKTQAAEIAAKYGFTETEVRALRTRGLGWGETEHALDISVRGRAPLAEVMDLRESGLGWGEIAQRYGLSLGAGARATKERRDREPLRDALRDAPKARPMMPEIEKRAAPEEKRPPMGTPMKRDPREGRVEQQSDEKGLLKRR